MKNKLRSALKYFNKKTIYILIFTVTICTTAGYSQPAPPGPGNGGGNPDTPLGVPFNSYMNFLLLLAGVLFAIIIFRRLQKRNETIK